MKPRTLKSQREIDEVLETGTRTVLGKYVVYFKKSATRLEAALAIQVPRRIGGAVRRNRIRRVIKEVCRTTFPRFQTGVEFVFIARSGAVSVGYHEAMQILGGFFEKEGFFQTAGPTAATS